MAPTEPDPDRPLDLVVHGATSFVGQILCRYLVERHGCDGPLRWAISGRDGAKLAQVSARTGASVERVVVDATDRAGLDALVARTRVVASTVGPYARYGSDLVAAAVAAGTDYCDLTGEPQWMRSMLDQHADRAARTGARVVHACGFDSIPSDLGVWFTQRRAEELLGEPCVEVTMRVASVRGGASGGTLASMMNLLEEAAADPQVRAVVADPYALNPPDLRDGPPQDRGLLPRRLPGGEWSAPFVMAAVNTKVVHRSHALAGRPWGPDFRYREVLGTGPGPGGALAAAGVTAGMGAFVGLASVGPLRRLLARRVLPQPGSGPSPRAQEAGSFDLRFRGVTRRSGTIETRVTGDRDPGYGSTARMLGEAAAALVELDRSEVGGGFWTPSTAFGERLLERLEAHAGLRFSVLP
jgi:short subunit dehydrogenase-like uncharacterized protein